jgi:hypothetical protein
MFGGFLRYGAWMLFDIVDDESTDDFSLLTCPSIQGLAGSLSTFMIHIVNFNGRIVNPKFTNDRLLASEHSKDAWRNFSRGFHMTSAE